MDLKAKEIENLASAKEKDKFVLGGSGKRTEVKRPSTLLRKDLKLVTKLVILVKNKAQFFSQVLFTT